MKQSFLDVITIAIGNNVYIGYHKDGQKVVRLNLLPHLTPKQLKAIEKYVRRTSG